MAADAQPWCLKMMLEMMGTGIRNPAISLMKELVCKNVGSVLPDPLIFQVGPEIQTFYIQSLDFLNVDKLI